jgi:hypothetical protein
MEESNNIRRMVPGAAIFLLVFSCRLRPCAFPGPINIVETAFRRGGRSRRIYFCHWLGGPSFCEMDKTVT